MDKDKGLAVFLEEHGYPPSRIKITISETLVSALPEGLDEYLTKKFNLAPPDRQRKPFSTVIFPAERNNPDDCLIISGWDIATVGFDGNEFVLGVGHPIWCPSGITITLSEFIKTLSWE